MNRQLESQTSRAVQPTSPQFRRFFPLSWLIFVSTLSLPSWAQSPAPTLGQATDEPPAQLLRLESGLQLDQLPANSWNHVLLVAKPRLASGAVDALSPSARRSAESFPLILLARTVPSLPPSTSPARPANPSTPSPPANMPPRLQAVGIGYATLPRDSSLVTLHSQTAKKQGIQLDLLSSRILATNEEHLQDLRLIASDAQSLLFDAPALILTNQGHRDATVRHCILIDHRDNALKTFVWLLFGPPPSMTLNSKIRQLVPNTQEDRRIHVDGSAFFLGFPNAKAFALEEISPGTELELPQDLLPIFIKPSYDLPSLQRLQSTLLSATATQSPAISPSP